MRFIDIHVCLNNAIREFIHIVRRAQCSFYKEIISLFECDVYDKCEVLERLVKTRLNTIKENNSVRKISFSFFNAEQSEINYLIKLEIFLKEKNFSSVIDYINTNTSQLKALPQLSKLLQTYFSIYSYLWSFGNSLISKDVVQQLNIVDLFKVRIDIAVKKKLKHLQKLNGIDINTHEGCYELACLVPHYISLINILARGDAHPSLITELSDLLLKNISTTCDIDLSHFFMDGLMHIIPYLNEGDKRKWLDLLDPFTERELLTNPERIKILKQLFNRSFFDPWSDYGIKRLIKIKFLLQQPIVIPNIHKHLYGFESEPLHKTDDWSVENHQKFLKNHAQHVKEFSTFTLDKMIAVLYLSFKKEFKRTREITESHYYMHLYDVMIEESRDLNNQYNLSYSMMSK